MGDLGAGGWAPLASEEGFTAEAELLSGVLPAGDLPREEKEVGLQILDRGRGKASALRPTHSIHGSPGRPLVPRAGWELGWQKEEWPALLTAPSWRDASHTTFVLMLTGARESTQRLYILSKQIHK